MGILTRTVVIAIGCLFIISTVWSQTLYWEKVLAYSRVYDIIYDGSEYLYFCSKDGNGNSKLLRSSDSGNSWEQVGNGLNTNYLTKLAIDSLGNLWGGNDFYSFGLFKSTDKGLTWNLILDSVAVNCIQISPSNTIWLGTKDGRIIFSTNQGADWEEEFIDSSRIFSVAINSSDHVFATTGIYAEGGKVHRSTDLGYSWEIVYNSNVGLSIELVIQHSTNHIYGFGYSGNLISTDNGNSWEENPRSRQFTQNLYLVSDSIFYVPVSSTGIRSFDFANWHAIGPMDPNAPLAFAFVDSIIFAGTVSGVFKHDPSVLPYIANTYFPLEVGNSWQHHSYCTKYNPIYYVDRDTIILNNNYYYLKGYYNDWVRYDASQKKLLLRYNDSDYVAMNFGLNNGSYFSLMLLNSHEIRNAQIIEPYQLSIFDSTYHSRGYFWRITSSTSGFADQVSFSEDLGETLSEYGSWGPGGSYFCDRVLIRALLYDSTGVRYLSDHSKPSIYFEADSITNSFDINWQFVVDHDYSYYSTNRNVNFIDTVYMVGYYSDGVNSTDYDTLGAISEPQSYDYSLIFSLDTAYIKIGYDFYYKIVAVDVGIVPETSEKPNSGFYKLIYDPNLVSVDDTNSSVDNYALYQNYPNPFNPTTKINYQIPEISFVTLKVYDVLGNEIATLVNEEKPAGSYEVEFNSRGLIYQTLPSGIYFYRLQAGSPSAGSGQSFVETKKMVLIR